MATQAQVASQPSLRMSMAAARAAQRNMEWKEGKPTFSPAWHRGNLQEVIMKKTRPLAPPEPRDPVPTLADLRMKKEEKMRCFNPALQQELLAAAEEVAVDQSAKLKQSMNGSIASRSLLGRSHSQHDQSVTHAAGTTIFLGGSLASIGDKQSASLRRKELMELQYKEENDRRLALQHDASQKRKTQKEDDFK